MKRKSIIAATVVLFFLIVTATGCNDIAMVEEHGEEQFIRCNVGAPPESIDPALSTGLNEFSVQVQLWEGLTRLDQNSRPQLAAAGEYEVDSSGTVYTFQLRPEARWSNGDPLTASDFEYAWKRVLDPEVGSEYAYMLFYIKNAAAYYSGEAKAEDIGVKALDEQTLQVTLEAPLPYFLDLLALQVFFPVHRDTVIAGGEGWALQANTIVGNGPFMLANWTGEQMELVPNAHYWDRKLVKLDRLVLTMVANEATALTLYETGHLDVTGAIPGPEMLRLKDDDALHIFPDLSIYYYIFNTEQPPLDDVRVRRALALAIDREAITDHLTGAGEKPAYGLVPPGITMAGGEDFRKKAGHCFDHDPVEAKRLLAEAGFPGGAGFPPLEILFNTSDVHKAVAEAIQEMWARDLGLTGITIASEDVGTYINSLRTGRFTIARLEWTADFADPVSFLDLWSGESGYNFGRWSDPVYDTLVGDLKQTVVEQNRVELMLEIEQLCMDGMPVAPIFFSSQPMMIAPEVRGYVKPSIGGIDFKTAFLAP